MPKTIEQRVKVLEETVKLLYGIVIDEKPYTPDQAEYDRAIRQIAEEGRTELLKLFMKHGGKFPKVYELPKKKDPVT